MWEPAQPAVLSARVGASVQSAFSMPAFAPSCRPQGVYYHLSTFARRGKSVSLYGSLHWRPEKGTWRYGKRQLRAPGSRAGEHVELDLLEPRGGIWTFDPLSLPLAIVWGSGRGRWQWGKWVAMGSLAVKGMHTGHQALAQLCFSLSRPVLGHTQKARIRAS